jgi:hypothetical protein
VSAPLTAIAAVVAVALVAGCSVVPLPKTAAEHDQSPREQEWDVKNCAAEAGYQTGYSPTDSPLLNWFQRLFFWSTAGAATGLGVMAVAAGAGATVTGPTFMSSPVGDAIVAGAGAGAITGTVLSWSGQQRFERAWIACMTSHGYTIMRSPEQSRVPPAPSP